ncbi:MAG: LamG domain-containing protein [Bacteroidales bacterium]|nr:LamG domain-containing protein [Bacteroidales bacterium]
MKASSTQPGSAKRTRVFCYILCYLIFTFNVSNGSFSQNISPESNLVAYYPFNGNTLDASGNDHHGTANGAILTSDRFERADSAYYFDGSNDNINCGDPPGNSLDLVNDFTITAWISLASYDEDPVLNMIHSIVAKDQGPGNSVRKWIFGLKSGKLNFHINGDGYGGGFWVYSQAQTININTWYHVVITKSGTEYTFYLNGKNIGGGTITQGIYDVNAPLTIGYSEPVGPFHGKIEEVRIYDLALQNRDILAVYYWDAPAADIKVFLEGPFNGTSMGAELNANGFIPSDHPYNQPPWNYDGAESLVSIPNSQVVDWVLIEFRDTTQANRATPAATSFRRAALLLADGTVTDLDGISPVAFNSWIDWSLFLVVRHRNHLDIQAAYPATRAGTVYTYDFTFAQIQVLGGLNGHKQIAPNIWGMTGGDGFPDGEANNIDKNDVWVPEAGSSGYYGGDFNLDGQVNNPDKNEIWIPNTGFGSQVLQ